MDTGIAELKLKTLLRKSPILLVRLGENGSRVKVYAMVHTKDECITLDITEYISSFMLLEESKRIVRLGSKSETCLSLKNPKTVIYDCLDKLFERWDIVPLFTIDLERWLR